jgi:hypothetical protein
VERAVKEARIGLKWRRPAFVVLVIVFALVHFLLSPLPYAVLGWFLEPGVVSHRVHETSFGLIFAFSVAGLLGQLRSPETKIAPMYQVVIPIYFTIAAVVLLDQQFDPTILVFLVFPVLLVALHPARPLLFRPPIHPVPVLAALALAATVPLVVFAVTEFRLGQQGSAVARGVLEDLPETASEKRYEQVLSDAADSPELIEAARHYGHWSAMGAFALSIAALAGLSALGMPGWLLPAWSAGMAAIAYGSSSLVVPSDASAANVLWATLAIVWGIAFVGVAQRERAVAARRVNADPP